MDALQDRRLIYVDIDDQGKPLESNEDYMGPWVTLEDAEGELMVPLATGLGQRALRVIRTKQNEADSSVDLNGESTKPAIDRAVATNPNNHASTLPEDLRRHLIERIQALLAA